MRKIFISSVVSGFEPYREAAREACELLGDRPVMCETFGARPYASEVACTTEVEQSDVYVLLLGERFGFEPIPGKSVTQQEFEAAVAARKPILAFVESGPKEPKQEAFQRVVEDYSAGFFRDEFTDPHSLGTAIIRGLRQLEQARSAIPEAEFSQLVQDRFAAANMVARGFQQEPSLAFAFLPQPARRIPIRDEQTDLDQLFLELHQLGLCELRSGFDPSGGTHYRGLTSKNVQYASFDDGFVAISAGLENPRSRDPHGFQFMYVDPALVQQRALAAAHHVAGGGGWFSLEIRHMENRWFGQPARSPGGGVQMPFHSTSANEVVRDLLIPAPEARVTVWVEDVMHRFARNYAPPRHE